MLENTFKQILNQHLRLPIQAISVQPLTGGDINRAYRINMGGQHTWFIKTNQLDRLTMFQAEKDGLETLRRANTMRCPEPLGCGTTEQFSYLLLEYIRLSRQGAADRAGYQLADLHTRTQTEFGWWRDNTIGSTPQANKLNADWVSFWREQRLLPQLHLAQTHGYPEKAYQQGLRLAEQLGAFFTLYHPVASLLHGDLWHGNLAYTQQGEPVMFDPAVYYGDRETDLALTELFGGFASPFYHAYQDRWPLDDGYKTRKHLYNLYHVLNHFNLFGGQYGQQAEKTVERLLAEI